MIKPNSIPESEKITFSFGENWLDFLSTVDEGVRAPALADLDRWLGVENIRGKSVIDVGSGSGLSSLSFRRAGCATLMSMDVDPKSVEATSRMRSGNADVAEGWTVQHGSILDKDFLVKLGTYDIVYSWGVLHHTGRMWEAIRNAASLCRDDGIFWISIYQGGPRYSSDLALKRKYNAADKEGKQRMIEERIEEYKRWNVKLGLDPENWNLKNERGMNVYHDIIDWLGGLPYEVARPSEIIVFCQLLGFAPERVMEAPEGGCSIYKFRKSRPEADHTFEYCTDSVGLGTQRTVTEELTDELRRADALYLETKHIVQTRTAAAERRAAVVEGQLASGTHIARAALQRVARIFKP